MTENLSRRKVLKGVGTGLAGTALAGEAVADPVDNYIVGASSAAGVAAARREAASIKRELDFEHLGTAVAGQFPASAVEALANNPHVDYVEEDGEVHALAQTLPWGVDRVDADVVHADGETGGDDTDGEGGADIAIIDTGIDSDHPDLEANLGTGTSYVSCGTNQENGNTCYESWDDDNDHGTHCAGIADAADNSRGVVGVSTAATLHAVKVLDGGGSGYLSDVAAGIEYVADQGWDVGSMSLGASSGSSTLKNACQYAADKGVLLVAAAGNSGPCSDCVGYPAAYSTVVAVSSTNSDDGLSYFSSTGPEVELAAPGSSIYSTVPGGYDTFSGTSMACPHVSGAGGQLMDNGYTSSEARSRLQNTAEDVGLGSNEQGSGLLDVEAAVGSGGGSNTAPTVDSLSASEVETSDGDAEFDVSWQVGDADGNLSSVDLTLTQDSDGSTEDTATVGVSGSSANGTTRLVAAGDEGSGNSYTVSITVTDGSGATASDSTSVSETEETNSSPTVDGLSASEVETSDGDAEFDVSWQVGDADGNLSSVDLTLTDDADGATEDTATVGVSGSDATGTTRLVAAGDDGSGHGYTVSITVTDGSGATASDSTSVSETEDTSSAPTIDQFGLSNRSNPAWDRYDVSWAVSDADGDLSSVTVEMVDAGGRTLDSATTSVGGSSASGTSEVRSKQSAAEIVLTVTDAAGNATSSAKSI